MVHDRGLRIQDVPVADLCPLERTDKVHSDFQSLLSNEQEFDLIFCNLRTADNDSWKLYFNRSFSDDPLFNHFVLSPKLLEDSSNEKLENAASEFPSVARSLGLETSVFLEDFWPRSNDLAEVFVRNGYRVVGGMKTHTKPLQSYSQSPSNSYRIVETRDSILWNEIFMDSFRISKESWKGEVLNRIGAALERNSNDLILLVAGEKGSETYHGCLLMLQRPPKVMGIYCVGTVPERRGKGVATEMLRRSEEIALSRGCEVMTLQTINEDNVEGLYQKLGYSVRFGRSLFSLPV